MTRLEVLGQAKATKRGIQEELSQHPFFSLSLSCNKDCKVGRLIGGTYQ